MFDPETILIDLGPFLLVHKDPCKDGTDDSCGWSYPKLNRAEREYAERLIDNEFDNIRGFFGSAQMIDVGDKSFFENCDKNEMKRRVRRIFQCCKKINRPWYLHPRFHFWHYKLYIRCFFLKKTFSIGGYYGS